MINLSSVLPIVVHSIVLAYILNLEEEKCLCSTNWKRDFIKVGSIVLIVANVLLLLFNQNIVSAIKNNQLIRFIYGIVAILSIVYSIICIIYFIELHQQKKCECSRDWKRYALLWPLIVFVLSFLIFIIALLFLLMTNPKMLSELKKGKNK